MHAQDTNIIRTHKCVQIFQEIIDKNSGNSIKAIAKDVKVSKSTARRIVHGVIRYKSYVMWPIRLVGAAEYTDCIFT